jgi:hypothetical protein
VNLNGFDGNHTLTYASPSVGGLVFNTRGGTGDDVFTLGDGVSLGAAVHSGAGNDRIDFSSFTTAVTVNLGLGTTGVTGVFGGDQQSTDHAHRQRHSDCHQLESYDAHVGYQRRDVGSAGLVKSLAFIFIKRQLASIRSSLTLPSGATRFQPEPA